MEKHRNADGTYNGVGVLSDLTGLPRADVLAIAERVKANQARLRACPYHEFELSDPGAGPMYSKRRYTCRHCGGEVGHSEWHWHEAGRRPRPA